MTEVSALGSVTRPLEVTIVGGGVFGLAAAWRLSVAGHRVTLHEAGDIPADGASSTDLSKLLRSAYGTRTRAYAPYVLRARSLWLDLEKATGRRIYHETGSLFLATRWVPGGFEHESHAVLRDLGFPVEVLGAEATQARHPEFALHGVVKALHDPWSGWLDPMEALPALADAAGAAGADIRRRSPVSDLGGLAGDAVLVCVGPWIKDLLPDLPTPIRVTRQHEVVFEVPSREAFRSLPAWSFDMEAQGWYGFPLHPSGVMKVARHVPGQEGHPDRRVEPTQEDLAAIRDWVVQLFPRLAGAPSTVRTCFYTSTPDSSFLFDRVPGSPRIFVAGCGGGHGFKFGPLLGEWARGLLEGDGVPTEFRLQRKSGTRII